MQAVDEEEDNNEENSDSFDIGIWPKYKIWYHSILFFVACVFLLAFTTVFLFFSIDESRVESKQFVICSASPSVCLHFVQWRRKDRCRVNVAVVVAVSDVTAIVLSSYKYVNQARVEKRG